MCLRSPLLPFLLTLAVTLPACNGSTDSADTAAPDLTTDKTLVPTDTASPDLTPNTDLKPETTGTADTLDQDIPTPIAPIGHACATDLDCNGGKCLDWIDGGYCTITDCGPDSQCPAGNVCVPLHYYGEEFTACLQGCDMAADCDHDLGHTCNRDATCWPQEGGLVLHPEGLSCILDTQCAADNNAVCYPEYYGDQPTGWLDGYCIIWNCEFAGCPSNLKCVTVNNDSSACMTTCITNKDCRIGYRCDAPGNVCVAGCDTSFDCPQKHICANSYCLESSFACSVTNPAGYCSGKQWCDNGTCKVQPFDCAIDDVMEPNNTMETAAPVTTDRLFDLKICENDEDWYKVTVPAGILTEFKLTFSNAAGNLDMLVFAEDGEFIRSRWINYPYQGLLVADFDVSNEAVTFFSPNQERTYHLQILGANGATNTYGLVTRHYPYQDGPACTDQFAADECTGMPDGIMKLYQFPEPDADDPYGGDAYHFETVSSYKWARRETIMLVRHAIHETMAMYPGTDSLGIIDACQEDGVTPGYNIGQPRHCRTCHDEGGNIDLAYYATDGNNMAKTVCGPDGTNVSADGTQCTEAAKTEHIVDLERQVYLMAKLFDSGRVRAIGIDPFVAEAVWTKANEMHAAGEISDEGWLGMKSKFGLWPTHHNHIHVSLDWWDHIYPEM